MASKIETIRNTRSVVINVPGHPSVEVNIDRLTDDMRRRLAIHGLAAKLGDGAARLRDTTTGQPAPWAEKYGIVRRIADALIADQWTLRAERTAPDEITAERIAAVVRATNRAPETVAGWLEAIGPERRVAAFAQPSVVLAAAAIRAERAAASADPDEDPFADLPGAGPDDEDNVAPL